MSDPSPTEPAAASSERPYIQAVHFEEWAPLGGPVTLELSPRRTVLVGRNGGGKSVLLEGLRAAMGAPYSHSARGESPPACTFDVRLGAGGGLHYQYRFRTDVEDPRRGRKRTRWTERAWQDDPAAPLWRVETGQLHQGGEPVATLGEENSGLLYLASGGLKPAASLNSLLTQVALVKIHLWRGTDPRVAVYAEEANEPRPSTLAWLAQFLCGWARDNPDEFEELNQVGRRIGIWKELHVQNYQPTQGGSKDSISAVQAVQVDGVNLGFVSDGTIRLLNIVIVLLQGASDHDMLLIDEPELGIHPGLLARLLGEFDAYGTDRQIVLATHSPQVVSWARPDELRFVERVERRTTVRSLSAEQAARVGSYLQDEGNLGEFVYGGGADE